MDLTIRFLCAAAVAAVLGFVASDAVAALVNWSLATGYAADTFHITNLYQFADNVCESRRGTSLVKVHPNNLLVKLTNIPASVESDCIPVGEVIMTELAKDIPVAGADFVPFVVIDSYPMLARRGAFSARLSASEAASTAAPCELAAYGMHVETPDFEIRKGLQRYGEKSSLE